MNQRNDAGTAQTGEAEIMNEEAGSTPTPQEPIRVYAEIKSDPARKFAQQATKYSDDVLEFGVISFRLGRVLILCALKVLTGVGGIAALILVLLAILILIITGAKFVTAFLIALGKVFS